MNEAPVPYNIPTDPIDNVKHYGQLRADSKILVFVETQYSKLGRDIVQSLEAIKFKYAFINIFVFLTFLDLIN